MHGEADPVVGVAGGQYAYEHVQPQDKTFHAYPGGLHEPHNDSNHAEVMADVRQWLDAHGTG